MIGRHGHWGGLGLAVALILPGCGQLAPNGGGQTPRAVQVSSRSIQQNEGPNGRVICNRRYRNCLRTLVPDLGDSALQTCQQRRDSCLDALGEGYFNRSNP